MQHLLVRGNFFLQRFAGFFQHHVIRVSQQQGKLPCCQLRHAIQGLINNRVLRNCGRQIF